MNDQPLAWPGPDWDAAWQRAVDLTADLALAQHFTEEQHRNLEQLGAATTEQTQAELDALVQRLGDVTVGGVPVRSMRLVPTSSAAVPPHPGDPATLRARLDAAAKRALAARAVRFGQALAALRGHPLQHLADAHTQETGQTLADYAAAMDTAQAAQVARCLRLMYVCSPQLHPGGGGTPPPGLEVPLTTGRVDQDAFLPADYDVDYDPYPGELTRLTKHLRPLAWELGATLVQAWNHLDLPQRRLVAAQWLGLHLGASPGR